MKEPCRNFWNLMTNNYSKQQQKTVVSCSSQFFLSEEYLLDKHYRNYFQFAKHLVLSICIKEVHIFKSCPKNYRYWFICGSYEWRGFFYELEDAYYASSSSWKKLQTVIIQRNHVYFSLYVYHLVSDKKWIQLILCPKSDRLLKEGVPRWPKSGRCV